MMIVRMGRHGKMCRCSCIAQAPSAEKGHRDQVLQTWVTCGRSLRRTAERGRMKHGVRHLSRLLEARWVFASADKEFALAMINGMRGDQTCETLC